MKQLRLILKMLNNIGIKIPQDEKVIFEIKSQELKDKDTENVYREQENTDGLKELVTCSVEGNQDG